MHQITPLLFADLSESCPISCPSIQDDGESYSLLTVDSKLNMFDPPAIRDPACNLRLEAETMSSHKQWNPSSDPCLLKLLVGT